MSERQAFINGGLLIFSMIKNSLARRSEIKDLLELEAKQLPDKRCGTCENCNPLSGDYGKGECERFGIDVVIESFFCADWRARG